MKNALSHIVSSLAEKRDKVKIEEESDGEIITFKIFVDKNDMGRIIGKNGKIIRAIRNVMKIPAIKQNKKINILLEEQN
ncbi:MAG: hypothetical protein A2958_02790 [Candidatus Levybacteria bacterium RIFCSPLOWO2_01_FULL_38_13]|nr:MAG: hypothetical protein A2629_03205 [Candidatus Levybacteria bacterium RIFCSPHIGHO2_01_FULL_41_15]OGH35264.1 MAG: hypothetical protein A2958_02790 [Candidatus Levybacteria bacterium RIFCSPLOWO2_01_FULL_38_13]